MPRRRNPSRVLGPYPKRSKWRLVFCDEGGAESYVTYETKEEAEQVEKALQRQLRLGLRAGEVVSRVVRDLDDGGWLLWIPCSTTEAGRRTLEVPELLRPHPLALTEATTLQSYASPGSAHHAGMGRVLTLLKGGQGKN